MPLDFKREQKEVAVPLGFQCDLCKRAYKFERSSINSNNVLITYPSFFHTRYTFGFGTEKDGSHIEVTICESCLIDFCDKYDIEIQDEINKVNYYRYDSY